MMTLERNGLDSTLIIYPTPPQFRCASMWLAEQAQSLGLPDEELYRLDICLNETLANIFDHSGDEAKAAPITLQINGHQHLNKGEATLGIIASGVKFDPFSVNPKYNPSSLDEAVPGGLGLLMLKQFSDKQSYHHHDDRNYLHFTVYWTTR